MAVSLLDVLASGRPDRSALSDAGPLMTGGLLAAALLLAVAAGRRPVRRR